MRLRRIRVALIIEKSGSYDRGLIRGIIQYSKLYSPWEFFLEAPAYTASDEKEQLVNKLKLWRPDFIVSKDTPLISEFMTWKIPVLVIPNKNKVQGVINIIANDRKIGEIGANYFIDKGFTNLAFYGSSQIFWSELRKDAFKSCAINNSVSFFEFEGLLNVEWQNNPHNLNDWLLTLPKPVAIMACTDEFGLHLIEVAEIAEIKIPQEIAVLGVDNDIFICELYNPPMSSIDQEPENVGFEVGRHIQLLFNNPELEIEEIVGESFHIVQRHSTDIMAITDKQLTKALQFISDHVMSKSISVDEVVRATFLSRRMLEIRFKKLLNRTIHQEISRIRIEYISQQLIETDHTLSEISFSMGMPSFTSFCNFFKRNKGISPNEFRRQFKKS